MREVAILVFNLWLLAWLLRDELRGIRDAIRDVGRKLR